MCGIAGIYSLKGVVNPAWIKTMADTLKHRGPDDEGYLSANTSTGSLCRLTGPDSQVKGREIETSDNGGNLLLGHRRLSILDISPVGHQPMSNRDGSVWIVYNGEIYNYIELREELKSLGYLFTTNTDTEVLLAAYEAWGMECLNRFNGMWAFVLYDQRRNLLFGARDRFGVKPLYYYNDQDFFVFASEMKALAKFPLARTGINPAAVFDYLVLGWEENKEDGFLKNIFEINPSFAFSYNLITAQFKKWQYYTLAYTDEWAAFDEKRLEEYAEKTRERLFNAIALRLRSDVPVGSCLSGGLDSSTIVCLINRIIEKDGRTPVGERQKVFTASYDRDDIDESRWARLVVERTRTSWYQTFPKGEEFLDDLEGLVYTQDIPFGSTTIYAQYRVMKLASESGIKVLLDGQGGDELFTGYKSYYVAFYTEMLKKFYLGKIFREIKNLRNSPVSINYLVSSFAKLWGATVLPGFLRRTAIKIMGRENAYVNTDFWNAHKDRLDMIKERIPTSLNHMLHGYITGLKLKTLLRYADRNSMRFSVETRTPFADDIDLIEYAFQIPSPYKIHNGWSKYLLRQMTSGLLPEEIRLRKDKIGFATPEYRWLNETKDVLRNYITAGVGEFIDADKMTRDWDRLMKNQSRNGITNLWRFINFAVWVKVYGM